MKSYRLDRTVRFVPVRPTQPIDFHFGESTVLDTTKTILFDQTFLLDQCSASPIFFRARARARGSRSFFFGLGARARGSRSFFSGSGLGLGARDLFFRDRDRGSRPFFSGSGRGFSNFIYFKISNNSYGPWRSIRVKMIFRSDVLPRFGVLSIWEMNRNN